MGKIRNGSKGSVLYSCCLIGSLGKIDLMSVSTYSVCVYTKMCTTLLCRSLITLLCHVTRLVMERTGKTTLAIGEVANGVGVIQEVGIVGIRGLKVYIARHNISIYDAS